MKQWDLRASAIIAAVWLLGMAMYSIWNQPAFSAAAESLGSALGATPVSAQVFGDEAAKHNKLPVRWAHQRWGAV